MACRQLPMSPTTAMSLTTTSRLPICRAHQDASSKQQGLCRRRVLQSAGLGLGLGPRPAVLRAPDVLLLDRTRDDR